MPHTKLFADPLKTGRAQGTKNRQTDMHTDLTLCIRHYG